ncbi:hypothetical protein MTO96_041220 [Rhipicephalus appendiculatus]
MSSSKVPKRSPFSCPPVALPYAVALIAVLVPLAKAFVLGAMNVLNLPFEVLVALYLLLYVRPVHVPAAGVSAQGDLSLHGQVRVRKGDGGRPIC